MGGIHIQGSFEPLHRYNLGKHGGFCAFDPLHQPLQGVTGPVTWWVGEGDSRGSGLKNGLGWGVELGRAVGAGEAAVGCDWIWFLIMQPLYRGEAGEPSSVERAFINK